MSRFKKQIPLLFLLLLTACLYRKEITFRPETAFNDPAFFSEIADIARQAEYLADSAKPEGKIRFYKITFRERAVENGNVIDFSNISNDSLAAPYEPPASGTKQELYLANIPMSNEQDYLYVYYSVNYNSDGNVVGFGPAYLGQLVPCPGDTSISQIEFFASLKSKRKAPYVLTKKKEYTDLKFVLAKNSSDSCIAVSKIVQAAPNKIGGTNPLVFDLDSILGRNRLSFIYINK